ncbi:hypothetical protein LUZ60_000633 [Juncus effusus]|nr:hypothetical protein LUZ60_000633 [Juncus effusus]
MSEEETKSRGFIAGDPQRHQQQHQQYGTFEGGVGGYAQQVIGFPQPAPPPGAVFPGAYPPPPYSSPPTYYPHGYQTVPGYGTVAEGRPIRLPKLPCCGIGIGWFLFVIGFFLAGIPWYVGAFILLCSRVDYREKPGLIVCTIAAVLAAIAVFFGVTKGADAW